MSLFYKDNVIDDAEFMSSLNLTNIHLTLERSLLIIILNSQILHDTSTWTYDCICPHYSSSVWDIKLSLFLPSSQMLIALMKEQCAAQSHRSLDQVSFGPGSFLDFYCMAYCISYSFHCNDLSNIQNYLP